MISSRDRSSRTRVATPMDLRPGELPRVKQADAGLHDMNSIMDRFLKTGQLPPSIPREPVFGDFSSPLDLQTAMDRVDQVNRLFNELPAEVREAAHHDPVVFLDMLQDPEARQVLEKAAEARKAPASNAAKPSAEADSNAAKPSAEAAGTEPKAPAASGGPIPS